ncbi:MAG: hypothetical protein QM791_12220 [Ferruginibacter sp.]
MEPYIIYSASSHMKDKVAWNEWVYCGIGNDLKKDTIANAINEYFEDSTLYFVNVRKNSTDIKKENVLERIETELEKHDLFIWDSLFEKVMEFNKIGVMRKGIIRMPK